MRLSVATAAICVCIVGFTMADEVHASIRRPTNIPAEGLDPALRTLAKDRNFQIVYVSEEIDALRTQGAVGTFTPEEALKKLLSGTGFTFRYLDEDTVTIVKSSKDQTGGGAMSPATTDTVSAQDDKKSSEDQLRSVQAEHSSSTLSEPKHASSNASAQNGLEEIVVSAQKQGDQNLLRVPVPVGVINTEQLAALSQVRVQDYFNQVPGFIVAPQFAAQTNLSIRGLNTGANPTVGVLIDDVPFGSATQPYIPELDPGDLLRVEVLRGPQSTLYGSDSMGGLVRFVTVAPSMEAFSGQVSAGTDSVHNGDGYGYSIRGSVNVPVSDTIAIRASAFRRQEAGYIYDTLTNDKGYNRVSASGERVAALWRPTETFSLTLNALSQTINSGGLEADPSLGDLRNNFIANGNNSQVRAQNFSAVVKDDLAGIHLTSITGYNTLRLNAQTDGSLGWGGFVASNYGVPPYAIIITPLVNNKLTEELRASTSIGQHVDVQVGGFYTHEQTRPSEKIVGANPYTGQLTTPAAGVSSVFDGLNPSTLDEYAGFADVTYHFTDRFDVQLGGRVTHIDQVFYSYLSYGISNAPNPSLTPKSFAHATPVTYLFTPRFFVTPDIMLYARAASGYRPGGSNIMPGEPPQYSPDKTFTYEVGTKGAFLDKKLTVDLSLYYVTWKDIQIVIQADPTANQYNGNGGAAKSEGVELTVTAKPFEATTVSGWVDYDDAVLTTSFPGVASYGVAGDRLPFATKYSANLSVRQDFPVINGITPFAAVDASYTGNRIGLFQPTALRTAYGGFTQTNVQTGFNYEGSSASLYVNNIADIRGQLNGGLGYLENQNVFVLIQPRTIGVSFTRKF